MTEPRPDQLSLFHHNPPHDAELQRQTFVDRRADLAVMERLLPGNLPCIRAIHGGSRVGKSHLAFYFLLRLDKSHHVFKVVAASGHTARLILKDLYHQIKQALQAVTAPLPLEPEGVGSDWLLDEARELIHIVDEVIPETLGERPKEVTVSSSFERTDTFGFARNALNITLADKETAGASSKFTLSPPDDYSLTEVIHKLCDFLYYVTGKVSVIYIDDIDLLDVGPTATQEQVVLLVRLLYHLASDRTPPPSALGGAPSAPPLPVVVASLRSRHLSIGHKEFAEVLRVKPLPRSEFRNVYQAHVHHFNGGRDVFDERCLEELINYTWGEIGSFLSVCRRFLTWGWQREVEADGQGHAPVLGVDDLKRFLREEVRALLLEDPNLSEHIGRIRDAVRDNQLEVTLDPAVLQTELVRWLLHDPPASARPGRFQIKALARDLLRETDAPQ